MSDFNAANRKDVSRREKAQRRWELERRAVVVDLMATEYGRRWMWEMISLGGVFRVNPDPTSMAFTEGQRSMANALMNEVMVACPEQFIQAMRESNARSSLANAPEPAERDPDEPHDARAYAHDADSERVFDSGADAS